MRLQQWIGRQRVRKADRRLKAELRRARRERGLGRERERNTGNVITLAMLRLQWARWRNQVLLQSFQTATPEMLAYWLKDLREPYLAYVAIQQRIADLREPGNEADDAKLTI